jgi:phage baseplate assembly protein W
MDKIVGFSNSNTTCTSSTLSDLELAKQDLMNHFRIARGEKWTNPDFGTSIPYYLFEPLTEEIAEAIEDEVRGVINYDPRFELENNFISIDYDDQSVTVEVQLLYIPLSQVTTLTVKFDRENPEGGE